MRNILNVMVLVTTVLASSASAMASESTCFDPWNPPSAYVSSTKQDIDDISLTENATLTLWGDNHDESFYSDFLRKNLPKLKAEGVSVLLMEMLPFGFTVSKENPQSPAVIREMLEMQFMGQWSTTPHERLIQAAVEQGFVVVGFFPTDPDKIDSPEIDELRKKRDHLNISDQFYVLNIMKILPQYSQAKFVVQVGEAHTNALYGQDGLISNHRMLGEFLYQGFQRADIRIPIIRKKFFSNYFVKFPQGKRPGCSKYEASSAYDGILYGN